MAQFHGILKRDNAGLYLQASDQNYRLILQRMPVDAVEKNVIVTGDIEGDNIIAEGVRLDENFAHPAI